MFADTPDSFRAAVEALRAKHLKQMNRLSVLAGAHAVACDLLRDWLAERPGRLGRIWLGDEGGSLHITLQLAKPEIFADAEAAFCRAQEQLRGAFPGAWHGEWSEVEDQSSEHSARRGANLCLAPTADYLAWFDTGAGVWLAIESAVDDQTACRVVKVGTRRVARYVDGYEERPIYRAVCPGDALPMLPAAE